MANRKRTPASSGQGPTIDATSAISALQRHKQKGLELASDAESDSTARGDWYNTTRVILAAAFGPESENSGNVMSAGPHHQIYHYNTPQSVMDAHARDNLRAAATMLNSCIEQLQMWVPGILSHQFRKF